MKKKVILSILVIISAFIITGCGNNVDYMELYKEKINEIELQYKDDNPNGIEYALIDIDNNNIPELLLKYKSEYTLKSGETELKGKNTAYHYYNIINNKVKDIYSFPAGEGTNAEKKSEGRIIKHNNKYYYCYIPYQGTLDDGTTAFGESPCYGLETDDYKLVATYNRDFEEKYENEELYKELINEKEIISLRKATDFGNNEDNSNNENNNNNNDQETKSGLKLNKYYVSDVEPNVKEQLNKSKVWLHYLKFINDKEVEINFSITGEDMDVIKTKYETYFEDNKEYIKIYPNKEKNMYFMCASLDNKEYALLRIDNGKLQIITDEENYEGLDMSGVRIYAPFDK